MKLISGNGQKQGIDTSTSTKLCWVHELDFHSNSMPKIKSLIQIVNKQIKKNAR